jgi:hypothetical protein
MTPINSATLSGSDPFHVCSNYLPLHRSYREEGIEGLANFGHEGSACRLLPVGPRFR